MISDSGAAMRRLDNWPTRVASESTGVAFVDGLRWGDAVELLDLDRPSKSAFCSLTRVFGSLTSVFGSIFQAGLGDAFATGCTVGFEYEGLLVRIGDRGALVEDVRRRWSEVNAGRGFDCEIRDSSASISDKMSM